MSDLRKAAETALEALENCRIEYDYHGNPMDEENANLLKAVAALRAALAQPEPFNPDWDRVKALEESLREHMAEIQRLKALAQPAKWTPQRKPLVDPAEYDDAAAAERYNRGLK